MKIIYQLFIFCFISSFCFADTDRCIVQSNMYNSFTLKGYDFPYEEDDQLFPIELGEELIIENEEFEYFPGGTYRVNFLIKSPINGQTQFFQSRSINNESYEVITKVRETNREIIRWTFNGDPNWFNCYSVYVDYELTLEDGTVYELSYGMNSSIDSKKEAEKVSKKIKIDEGDILILGKEWVHMHQREKEGKYEFHPHIFSGTNGEEKVGHLHLLGPMRASNPNEGRLENAYELHCHFDLKIGGGGLIFDPIYTDAFILKDFGKFSYFRTRTKIAWHEEMKMRFIRKFTADNRTYYQFEDEKKNQIDFYAAGSDPIGYFVYYYSK